MFSRWGRLMVAFAAALAVWAIATPAFAAAPLCDPRGATGVAPAPQLQQPETSLDVDSTPPSSDCQAPAPVTTRFDGGRTPAPAPTSTVAADPVLPGVTAPLLQSVSRGSFARDGVSGTERAGARTRVDRPPRA